MKFVKLGLKSTDVYCSFFLYIVLVAAVAVDVGVSFFMFHNCC